MARKAVYVLARNGWGRATLQHAVPFYGDVMTKCGRDIRAWSRAYSDKPIEVILCKHPACREGLRDSA